MSQTTRISVAFGVALGMISGAAVALTPLPPCDGEESGMYVYGARYFGDEHSGFVIEGYRNLDKDAVIGGAPGPLPELDNFNGSRIIECRSGHFVALHGAYGEIEKVLGATEFLRGKIQNGKRFGIGHVRKAARAVYGKDSHVRMVNLRETDETCACGDFFPGMWTGN